MEPDFLQISIGVGIGLILGVVLMLLLNKLKSGSASPAAVKAEFDEYKNDVEAHFETTSKKFKQMTEQYQDLYDHLSVGATSLCRPESVAAALADDRKVSEPARLEEASNLKEDPKTAEKQQTAQGSKDSEAKVRPEQTEAATATDDAELSPAEDSDKAVGDADKTDVTDSKAKE